MQKVVHDNGVVLYWDDTLQVGDLITAYDGGFHIVTGFEYRKNQTPLISHVMMVKADGAKVKKPGVTRHCDAAFVRRVTRQDIEKMHADEVNAAIAKRDNLLNFVSG